MRTTTTCTASRRANQLAWIEKRGWEFDGAQYRKGTLTAESIEDAVRIQKFRTMLAKMLTRAEQEERAGLNLAKRKAEAEFEASLPTYLESKGWTCSERGVWSRDHWEMNPDLPGVPARCYRTLKQAVKIQAKLDAEEASETADVEVVKAPQTE